MDYVVQTRRLRLAWNVGCSHGEVHKAWRSLWGMNSINMERRGKGRGGLGHIPRRGQQPARPGGPSTNVAHLHEIKSNGKKVCQRGNGAQQARQRCWDGGRASRGTPLHAHTDTKG